MVRRANLQVVVCSTVERGVEVRELRRLWNAEGVAFCLSSQRVSDVKEAGGKSSLIIHYV